MKMNEKQKNLLLSKMILKGEKIKDLSTILKISMTAVQNKLNGQTRWSKDDIIVLSKRYKLTPEDEHNIFLT